MIFYWLTLLIVLSAYGWYVWRLSGKSVGPLFIYRKTWILEHFKICLLAMIGLVISVTFLYHKPLGKTIWCSYKGYEHSVETRRDWISGVCSYKGPNGAWIPIERLLGFPEGDKDEKENNHPSLDQTNN